VVLGGPPCQGFSRIGRGKIRSLREDRVHVHYDEDAGDIRNRLLHKYVLFVSALAPDVFLFENVRHFQSEVKTPTGKYLATDVLSGAIREISGHGPRYHVAQRIVVASDHLVPQTRERFFMVGVRSDVGSEDIPAWCIDLPIGETVPLRAALDGLPEPCFVTDREGDTSPIARKFTRVSASTVADGSAAKYRVWIEQAPPASLSARANGAFDAHCARPARHDDASFFELLGPGKRWMDYRAEKSPTVAELREILTGVLDALRSNTGVSDPIAKYDARRVEQVLEKINGSLPLRLLLENIEPLPGELQHHLLTSNYLAKRDGKHGDWLARLHPDEPCKTIVTHMGKDTYAYVHPSQPRTLSIREAARVQTFPDWFHLGELSMVDAFRVIGNAVPPLLGVQFADRIARVVWTYQLREQTPPTAQGPELAPIAALA
jgi:site-specific DNA-cytosine methylase